MKKTYQFEILLTEPDSVNYTEVNWLDLLAGEEQKLSEDQQKNGEDEEGATPHDEDQLNNKIPKKEKEKVKKRYDDFEHLGQGYDESDSFIDNSEFYDEIVPEGITTAFGGFYINNGELEFKEQENEVVGLSLREEKKVKKLMRFPTKKKVQAKEKKKVKVKLTEVKRKSVKEKDKKLVEALILARDRSPSLSEKPLIKPPAIINLEAQLEALSPKPVAEAEMKNMEDCPVSVLSSELSLPSSVTLSKITDSRKLPGSNPSNKTGWWKNVDFSNNPKEISRAAQSKQLLTAVREVSPQSLGVIPLDQSPPTSTSIIPTVDLSDSS